MSELGSLDGARSQYTSSAAESFRSHLVAVTEQCEQGRMELQNMGPRHAPAVDAGGGALRGTWAGLARDLERRSIRVRSPLSAPL